MSLAAHVACLRPVRRRRTCVGEKAWKPWLKPPRHTCPSQRLDLLGGFTCTERRDEGIQRNSLVGSDGGLKAH